MLIEERGAHPMGIGGEHGWVGNTIHAVEGGNGRYGGDRPWALSGSAAPISPEFIFRIEAGPPQGAGVLIRGMRSNFISRTSG